jgi:osmotically-inducible protein OsmY
MVSSSVKAEQTFGEKVKGGFESATEKTVSFGRQAGKKINDASITSQIKAKLLADESITASGINVDTVRKVVYLKGYVPNQTSRRKAILVAQRTKGVIRVVDLLTVGGR